MIIEEKKTSDTRLLPPLDNEKRDYHYGTFIMSRTQSLRRLLTNIPGKSGEQSNHVVTKVTLIIRGMAETLDMEDQQAILLGRADFRSGGFQPDVDLSPYGAHERGVSRAHARLHVQDGKVYLTDLYSANGTVLEHEKIEPEQPHLLKNGDEFTLGALAVRVKFS
ncbi:MAG: FHA domain-containing protein [Anaerolineae bacterium]